MYMIAAVFSCVSSFFIGTADFKSRSVRLLWFLCLFAGLAVWSFLHYGYPDFLYYTGINWFIVLLYIATLKGYLYLKYGSQAILLDTFLGKGDVIMLLAIAPLLPHVGFIVFVTASAIIGLLLHFFYYRSRQQTLIPLAGIQAWMVIPTIAYRILFT